MIITSYLAGYILGSAIVANAALAAVTVKKVIDETVKTVKAINNWRTELKEAKKEIEKDYLEKFQTLETEVELEELSTSRPVEETDEKKEELPEINFPKQPNIFELKAMSVRQLQKLIDSINAVKKGSIKNYKTKGVNQKLLISKINNFYSYAV